MTYLMKNQMRFKDLKCEDGKYGKKHSMKTPYLTPISSPQFFIPLNYSSYNCSLYNQHGFSLLFESTSDAEFNRLKT
jgi:hypothetical protein